MTILEVLFATGIAISGMLGIASLLLMAGRQASQANRATESQALAQDWYNEFLTRGMNEPANWIWYSDYPTPAVARFNAFSKDMLANPLLRRSFSVGSNGDPTIRPYGKYAVCIDPAFYSDRTIRSSLAGFVQSQDHWYRPAVFPYYQDGFNPTTDSDFSIATTQSIAWSDQPRMLRVTLDSPFSQLLPLNEKQVQNLFSTQDDLTMVISQKDRSLPATRDFQFMPHPTPNNPPNPPVLATGMNKTQYSWLATLSPLEQANRRLENYYTLSLVVLYQRDRLFIDPSTFQSRSSPQPNAVNKPQGERLTWVFPMSGDFTGGNGGRVRLVASEGTDDTVVVGDWIMLAKHVGGIRTFSPMTIEPYSVFRWFRIVAVDEKPTVGSLASLVDSGADPFGNTPTDQVWTRDVVLEGPDWSFVNAPLQGGGVLPAPTTGTLVKGAVSVYERVVEVPDIPGF